MLRTDVSPAPLCSVSLQTRSPCGYAQGTITKGQTTVTQLSRKHKKEIHTGSAPVLHSAQACSSRFGSLPRCERTPSTRGKHSSAVRAGQLAISYKLLITEEAGEPSASTRTSLPASRAMALALSLSGRSTPPAQAPGHGAAPSPSPRALPPSAPPAAPALPAPGNGLSGCQLPAATRHDGTLLPGLLQAAPPGRRARGLGALQGKLPGRPEEQMGWSLCWHQ